MTKSATELMQEILFASVVDAVVALKSGTGGLPNALLRDVNAIHANVTLADLPEAVRDSIAANVRAAFTRLLKEGYSVAPRVAPPPRGPSPASVDARPPRRGPPGPRGPAPTRTGPRPGGGRPGGPPKSRKP